MNTVIENKTTGIKLTEERNVKYADLIATIVNKPLKDVIDIKSMRAKLNMLKVCEEAQDTIEFTEEQFKAIAPEVENSQWAIVHPDIIDFVDYIAEIAKPLESEVKA